MVTAYIPANFIAERTYAIHILLKHILGIEVTLVPQHRKDYEFVLANGNRLHVTDAFWFAFNEDDGYLHAKNIPQDVSQLTCSYTEEPHCPNLFGSPTWHESANEFHLDADVIAGAFFMLTRWEETVQPRHTDAHGRFLATHSVAVKHHFLHRPVVNEYAVLLKNILAHLGYNLPFKEHVFTNIQTHDVDHFLLYNSWAKRAWMSTQILVGNSYYKGLEKKFYAPIVTPKNKDLYNTFSFLMDVAEQKNTKAYFFLKATPKATLFDEASKLKSAFAQSIIQEIKTRGHYIGFHPGYYTHVQPTLWHQEKTFLENAIGQPVTFGRQHFLRFNAPQTWALWNDAGMEWESSCGYTNHPGFRAGMCMRYPVFDVLQRKQLRLQSQPLIAMETSFFQNDIQNIHPRFLSVAEFESQWLALQETVKKYNGQFCYLWHNNTLLTPQWLPYSHVFTML